MKISRWKKTLALDPQAAASLIALLLLGLGGFAVVVYTTRWGAGLMDDAFIYITSAKNLVAGRGLVWPWGDGSLMPMTYFPPMFPFTLATFQFLGVDAGVAARWVNAIAFGANVFLAGLLSKRVTRSWRFALLGSLLVLISDVLIEVHSWAMSEPLYLLLTLSGFLLLSLYLERSRRFWLIGAAILLGLAFLTRYIGGSLILAASAVLLLNPESGFKRRLNDSFWFGLVSLLPMAGWMARTILWIGSPIDRSPERHLVTLSQIQKGLNTLLVWFIPGRLVNGREFLTLAVLVVLGAALWMIFRRSIRGVNPTLPSAFDGLRLLLVFQIVFHLFVLWVSKSFFEPSTPLNDRILSPILPSILILIVALLSDLWRTGRLPWRLAALAFSLALVGFYAFRSADLVPRLHDSGLGIARKVWHNSQTLEYIREMPEVPLFTNSPAAVYMWAGRPAYPIYNLAQMRQSMQENHAALVIFNSISVELYGVTMDELTQGLTLVQRYKDGSIYQISP